MQSQRRTIGSSWVGLVACSPLIAGLIFGCGLTAVIAQAASAQELSGNIPAGKVLTPGGRLVDAECVFEIPEGAHYHLNGDVTLDGALIDHHAPCRPTQMGMAADRENQITPPGIGHSWVEDTWGNANTFGGLSFYNYLSAYWTVPGNPPMPCFPGIYCQILYLFPSFQNGNNEIVQPVLQYGYNGSFGGANWTIAAWYVSGSAGAHSTPKTVYPGDTILGVIGIYDVEGAYDISISDLTTNVSTYDFYNTSGYPFNTVQGGAMEVWYLNSCSQYPSTNPTVFSNIQVWQADGAWNTYHQVQQSWTTNVGTGLSPSCSYGASATQSGWYGTATMMYSN